MNKKDAAVYKALAELGFDNQYSSSDPELDEIVKKAANEEERFLTQVERLFTESISTDEWSFLSPKDVTENADQIFELISKAYQPVDGHPRIRNINDVTDSQLSHWEGMMSNEQLVGVIFGRQTNFGMKISGWGHNNTQEIKRSTIRRVATKLHEDGVWMEASNKPAHILLDMNTPFVYDPYVLEQIYKQRIQIVEDGPFYRRLLPHGKLTANQITFGTPKIS